MQYRKIIFLYLPKKKSPYTQIHTKSRYSIRSTGFSVRIVCVKLNENVLILSAHLFDAKRRAKIFDIVDIERGALSFSVNIVTHHKCKVK